MVTVAHRAIVDLQESTAHLDILAIVDFLVFLARLALAVFLATVDIVVK